MHFAGRPLFDEVHVWTGSFVRDANERSVRLTAKERDRERDAARMMSTPGN